MISVSGYERRIGRYSGPLAACLADLVKLRPGQRVLDVACGSGALTAVLAAAVGAEGVSAVDVAPSDVAACRARVPRADVRVADAGALPFGEATFDAVFAQLLVHLVDDAPRVVGEMRRVARRDAPVVSCVWDFAQGMTALRAFWDAVAATGAPNARGHDQKRYPYATPPELEQLWTSAGLRDVESGECSVVAGYEDFDDLWVPLTIPDGTPGQYLATLDERQISAIRRDLHERIGAPRGEFRLAARAWYVVGRA